MRIKIASTLLKHVKWVSPREGVGFPASVSFTAGSRRVRWMRNKGLLTVLVMLSLSLVLTVSARAQPTPGSGDLIINEIMYNPSGSEPNNEWFEVKNVAGSTLDVNNCTISSGSATHTITSAPTIAAGDYFVFARGSSITGVTIDYSYGSSGNIRLSNSGSDDIAITCDSTTIDSVTYGTTISSGWPANSNGKSISFGVPTGGGTDYATLNNDGSNWKHSTSQIGGGNTDLGTPGAKNDDVLGATAISLSSLNARSGQTAAQPQHALNDFSGWSLAVLVGVGLAAVGASIVARRRR